MHMQADGAHFLAVTDLYDARNLPFGSMAWQHEDLGLGGQALP
jgi:hypothetical protein